MNLFSLSFKQSFSIVCYFPFFSGFCNFFISQLGFFTGNSLIYPWNGTFYTFLSVLITLFFLEMRDTKRSRHKEFSDARAPTFLRRLTTVLMDYYNFIFIFYQRTERFTHESEGVLTVLGTNLKTRFIFKVRSTDHTDPSRKSSFTPEDSSFSFKGGGGTELFETHGVTIIRLFS